MSYTVLNGVARDRTIATYTKSAPKNSLDIRLATASHDGHPGPVYFVTGWLAT